MKEMELVKEEPLRIKSKNENQISNQKIEKKPFLKKKIKYDP